MIPPASRPAASRGPADAHVAELVDALDSKGGLSTMRQNIATS